MQEYQISPRTEYTETRIQFSGKGDGGGVLDERLLNKNGRAAVMIARELFDWQVGAQILRVADYARKLTVGNGTVQGALHLLSELGAIHLETRGQLGTYLVGIDRNQTRAVAGLGPLLGSIPLPYSRRYEGLATALYEVATRRGLSLSLNYMRGGAARIAALMRGQVDFTVVSAMAYEIALASNPELMAVAVLPQGTYVGDHALLLQNPNELGIADGMLVGVDPSSIDQVELTRAECSGRQVTMVEAPYTVLLEKLLRREIDALTWNADDVQVRHPDITVRQLRSDGGRELSRRRTEAALVTRADRHGVVELLREVMDPAALTAVQGDVLSGARLPSY